MPVLRLNECTYRRTFYDLVEASLWVFEPQSPLQPVSRALDTRRSKIVAIFNRDFPLSRKLWITKGSHRYPIDLVSPDDLRLELPRKA